MSKKFLIIFSILILTSLVFYIFQVNALTKETYLSKNYEKNLAQLSSESETLKVDFSKVNSLSNLENYLQNGNFEKVTQVKYIQILETSVAARPR
jgi:predicted membrane protein